jgi:hypothetical protein
MKIGGESSATCQGCDVSQLVYGQSSATLARLRYISEETGRWL